MKPDFVWIKRFIKQYLFVDIRDILCKWLHYNRKTYGLGFNQGQRMNVIASKSSCMDAPDIWLAMGNQLRYIMKNKRYEYDVARIFNNRLTVLTCAIWSHGITEN